MLQHLNKFLSNPCNCSIANARHALLDRENLGTSQSLSTGRVCSERWQAFRETVCYFKNAKHLLRRTLSPLCFFVSVDY